MGYGIGSFIVPLYAYPFLAERSALETNQTSVTTEVAVTSHQYYDNNTGLAFINDMESYNNIYHNQTGHFNMTLYNASQKDTHEDFTVTKESKIEYAYGIAAISLIFCSVTFLVYQIQEMKYARMEHKKKSFTTYTIKRSRTHENKKTTFLQMINPATCADGRFWYGSKIFVLIFLFMGNLGGCERMIGSFIRSFAIDQLEFSSVDASLLNTFFWISFSVGRLVFALVAKWVSVRVLIIVETLGMALCGALLNIFATNNSTALWVLMQPVGFLGAPLWPTGVAFTDYHVKLTGIGMTVQILGASVGGIVHLRLIGYLYETFGPRTFLYQLVGSGCLGLIIAVVLDLVGAKHGNRYGETKESNKGKTGKAESEIFMSDEMRDY